MRIAIAKLRHFMEDIAAKRGDFTFFGLIMRAETAGKWDLVVSAPWLEQGKLKALSEFSTALSEAIGDEQVRSLSKVVSLYPNDPGLRRLAHLRVVGAKLDVRNVDLEGLKIKRALILRSTLPLPTDENSHK